MQCNKRQENCVVAYKSHTFNLAESNYSITQYETLTEVWAINHFHDITLGYETIVFTKHAAITELFKGKRYLMGKLKRWHLTI